MLIAIFLLRRLAVLAAVLLGISFLIFALLELSPGSTVTALLGGRPASPALVRAIESKYHLNDPFLVQYWDWLSGVLHGDLGSSTQSGQSVTTLLREHLAVTLELAGLSVLLSVTVGVAAGFAAGVRRGGALDRTLSSVSVLSQSAPSFTVGILLIYLFGVRLAWFPVYGGGSGPLGTLSHLVLPVATLTTSLIALVIRQTRAAVLGVMEQDYITFARARGLSTPYVNFHYALRNSSLPIVTSAGLLAIYAVSGTVLVEAVFSLPGLGSLLVSSIQAKDVPVAQGVALLIALAIVLVNLCVDVLILALDPRARISGGG